jgi:TonB family protein
MQRRLLFLCLAIYAVPASAEFEWEEYPPASVAAGEQGLVVVSFGINLEGKAEKCIVLRSSGYPRLDTASCDLIIVGRYEISHDQSGKPKRILDRRVIRWILPHVRPVRMDMRTDITILFDAARVAAIERDGKRSTGRMRAAESIKPEWWVTTNDYPKASLAAGERGTVEVLYDITPGGRVRNCEVLQSSGYDQLDAAACLLIEKNGRYRPATDGLGHPIASVSMQRIRWDLPR